MDREFYTATCRGCGVIIAACVDKPEYHKYTMQDIHAWAKRGDIVNHIVADTVVLGTCRCKEADHA